MSAFDVPFTSDGSEQIATIDLLVYGMDAVLKSAHRFTGRCFVHLKRTGDVMELRMRPKAPNDEPDVVMREFFNDLLEQRLRSLVAAETAGARDLIMAHALSRTTLIRPDLEVVDPRDDPGRIALPDRARGAAV